MSATLAQMVKCVSTMRETWVRSLGWEDPLEKEMAIHSSTIAWKIPWTEEPGRLQPMGLQSRTRLSDFTFTFKDKKKKKKKKAGKKKICRKPSTCWAGSFSSVQNSWEKEGTMIKDKALQWSKCLFLRLKLRNAYSTYFRGHTVFVGLPRWR